MERRPRSWDRGCGRPKETFGLTIRTCADCGREEIGATQMLVCPACGGPLASGRRRSNDD